MTLTGRVVVNVRLVALLGVAGLDIDLGVVTDH